MGGLTYFDTQKGRIGRLQEGSLQIAKEGYNVTSQRSGKQRAHRSLATHTLLRVR